MKKFIEILMCVLILFCPFLKAQAESEKPEDIMKVDDFVSYSPYRYPVYNNYILYGLDWTSINSYLEDSVVKLEEADAGLRYIMNNSFPNKKNDNISEFNYIYATEKAIINYMIKMGYVDTEGENKQQYEESLESAKEFISELEKIYDINCTNGKWDEHCESVNHMLVLLDDLFNEPVEVQKEYEKNYTDEIILNGDSELKKSEDGKYYETGLLSVKRSDVSEYSVELTKVPEGTLIADKNGDEKTKFNINDEFKIKVPVDKVNSNQINIKINIDDTFNTYYIYKSQHYPTAMSYKKMPLDDGFINVIYSKPYSKNIKESKEFYLDIKADSIVSVPPTAAYIPLIILSVGLLAIILSFTVIMKKVKSNI